MTLDDPRITSQKSGVCKLAYRSTDPAIAAISEVPKNATLIFATRLSMILPGSPISWWRYKNQYYMTDTDNGEADSRNLIELIFYYHGLVTGEE
jgi:hypothetical protein